MTREKLDLALIDLGWVTLIHRVLRGKPSSSFALHQLMLAAGRPVTYEALVRGYADFHVGGGAVIGKGSETRGPFELSTRQAITTRIIRLRALLADIGVEDAITTLPEVGYIMQKADRARVEAALLEACGFELEAA